MRILQQRYKIENVTITHKYCLYFPINNTCFVYQPNEDYMRSIFTELKNYHSTGMSRNYENMLKSTSKYIKHDAVSRALMKVLFSNGRMKDNLNILLNGR